MGTSKQRLNGPRTAQDSREKKKAKKTSGTTGGTKSKVVEPTEHQIQCGVVDWCALKGIPIFAIPNGGYRAIVTAMRMQREGVKAGVPDLFIPIVKAPFGGLWIEMKTKKGWVDPKQKFWLDLLSRQYATAVCRSLEDGIETIKSYLAGDHENRTS
jgi:hypothetical protein